MIIAVTYENGKIFQHFGHTEQFKLYETENGKIIESNVISTLGEGHGALAGLLGKYKVDLIICGGIGEGAQRALHQNGIEIRGGVSGDADEAVEKYLKGELEYNPNIKCTHHEGEHNCGGHSHKHNCGNNADGHNCDGHHNH